MELRVSGTGGNEAKTFGAGERGVFVELLGRHEAFHGGMLDRGLQILADGQEIDVGDAQIVHDLHDFSARLAQTDHQTGFGEDGRITALHLIWKQAEPTDSQRAPGPDRRIKPRHRLHVMVEHVGAGIGDDLHGAGLAQEIGGQHFHRRVNGRGGPDRGDGGGEVRGAAIGQVVAIHAG